MQSWGADSVSCLCCYLGYVSRTPASLALKADMSSSIWSRTKTISCICILVCILIEIGGDLVHNMVCLLEGLYRNSWNFIIDRTLASASASSWVLTLDCCWTSGSLSSLIHYIVKTPQTCPFLRCISFIWVSHINPIYDHSCRVVASAPLSISTSTMALAGPSSRTLILPGWSDRTRLISSFFFECSNLCYRLFVPFVCIRNNLLNFLW